MGVYTHEFISRCFNIYRFEKSFRIRDLINALEENKHNVVRILISEALERVETHYLDNNEGYERYLDYKEMYSTLMNIQDTKVYGKDFKLLQQGGNIK